MSQRKVIAFLLLNGRSGIANKEIKAFQPFFVDLNPPRILTEGDEIFLPVQIRNYTETKQKVDVEMAQADWFSFIGADKKQIEVRQNSTENAVFGFRADVVKKEGLQKVTAFAETDSDAIEKPVEVKPDGKEIVGTQSEIFTNSTAFDVNFPADALPGNRTAEVKIYPNLLAHVAESVEGLLQRPYGCGEQTISSTYPNVMVLKFTKQDNRLRPLANKFLQKGYERLLGYQVASGGFSYWGGRDEADAALTGYALRFLSDAKEFIAVDETVIEKARNWLINQQQADGSFTKKYYGETSFDKKRTWQITTYITRSLAMTERGKTEKNVETQNALQKAFVFLKPATSLIDEPFALANLGLALIDAGNMEDAQIIAAKLETMWISEGDSVYWKLETNTPFYGWGTAGRIETTALVVNLLAKISRKDAERQRAQSEELIGKGVLFLLKNKDRYGVWHSTQATINVLDAILATLGDDKEAGKQTAEIFVNGQSVKKIELPPADELAFPVSVKIDSALAPVNNRIEVKTGGNQSAMVQIVQTHYISWRNFTADGRNTNESRQVRLDYKCDKLEAQTAEEITCNVEAERVGFQGYGMLLAEIGLPPGADVDRASLEKAKDADWSFTRYDVLPDRIIIYMWAKAGGTNFNFKFKPRYEINAQTAPSVLYDYYNEEAKATLAPLRFSVK